MCSKSNVCLREGNLLVAIIDVDGNNLKIIEDDQYNKFIAAMQKIFMDFMRPGNQTMELPKFTENRNTRRAIKIKCNDSSSRRWLEEYVPAIPMTELWEGANLVVIDFNKLPKPETMNIWCPGVKGSNAEIFELLQTCNPGLNTSNWSVLSRKTTEKGTSIRLDICATTRTFIESNRNRLYFGIAQAICNFQKNMSKKQIGIPEAAEEMEHLTEVEVDIDAYFETENECADVEMDNTVVKSEKPAN